MSEFKITEELLELFKKSGSNVREEALQAQAEIAKAVELPLRQGIMY